MPHFSARYFVVGRFLSKSFSSDISTFFCKTLLIYFIQTKKFAGVWGMRLPCFFLAFFEIPNKSELSVVSEIWVRDGSRFNLQKSLLMVNMLLGSPPFVNIFRDQIYATDWLNIKVYTEVFHGQSPDFHWTLGFLWLLFLFSFPRRFFYWDC